MASATTKDMTHGVPWRLIAGFAIPVFLSQLFQQLYNTADSLIVSNFLGDNALAAVSASGPLIFLLISFFAGAASGVGVAIGIYGCGLDGPDSAESWAQERSASARLWQSSVRLVFC